jgi:ABC-type multidrug transport system fused ATPase/permease subunit
VTKRTVRQAIRDSLRLLDRRDRRLFGLTVVAQMSISLLDLAGVLLIGVLGAVSMGSLGGQQPGTRIHAVLSAIGLGDLSATAQIAAIGGAAAFLLLAKSAISPILLARVFRFLARREVLVSGQLTRQLLSRPLTFVQQRSSHEAAAALVQGANAAVVVILGQTAVAASEAALLIAMSIVLLVANPAAALGAIAFFVLVGVVLQGVLGNRAARFAQEQTRSDVASRRAIQEALGTYREITVTDRRSLYADRIQNLREMGAQSIAGSQLVNALPKYVSEGALVLGAFALAGALFSTQSVATAAGTFTLFLAAATRVMPSLLRLQAAALYIRAGTGSAAFTFALVDDLGNTSDEPRSLEETRSAVVNALQSRPADFDSTITLQDVGFSYPEASGPAIQGVSIVVAAGESVALIGRSGAGKSTLADLILGVLLPQSGDVRVGGLPPSEATKLWPGSIAYVPQDVMLTDDSVRANVALVLPRDVVDDEMVWDALRRAQLAEYIQTMPDGLDTQIGERGLRLSGGQRQRLGVARALFTRPRLLVLDEATSALDAETEQGLSRMLQELEKQVTMVIVAHRLSTVRHADLIVYLEAGQVLAEGTFDDVCERVPALQHQATLMGLRP